jgi:tRNA(fMet)-specific endonuclease VapC
LPIHLLDTGILLRQLRRRPGFDQLLIALRAAGPIAISVYTRLEVLQGMRDHERARTFLLLDRLATYPFDTPTAAHAAGLIRDARARGVTLAEPDAIIAATALAVGATLVTLNVRHFSMPDLDLLAVDEAAQVRPPEQG